MKKRRINSMRLVNYIVYCLFFSSDRKAVLRYYANSAEPDQTPHIAASDQGLHSLLNGISMRIPASAIPEAL